MGRIHPWLGRICPFIPSSSRTNVHVKLNAEVLSVLCYIYVIYICSVIYFFGFICTTYPSPLYTHICPQPAYFQPLFGDFCNWLVGCPIMLVHTVFRHLRVFERYDNMRGDRMVICALTSIHSALITNTITNRSVSPTLIHSSPGDIFSQGLHLE